MSELRDILYLEEIEVKEADDGKQLRFRGKCQEADVINNNGRVYPLPILQREVARLQPEIAERRVLMQADHPASGRPLLQDTVARIDKLEFGGRGGKSLYLEGTLLNTAKGRDVREVMKSARIGLSSRGTGKTIPGDWNGKKAEVVQDDFSLKTFDLVVGGSVRHAEVTVLREWEEAGNVDTDTAIGKLTESEKVQLKEALKSNPELTQLLNRWLEQDFVPEALETLRNKLSEESGEITEEKLIDVVSSLVEEHLGAESAEKLLSSLTRKAEQELQREKNEQLTEEQKLQKFLART